MTIDNQEVQYTGEVDNKGRPLAMYKGMLVREVANGALQRVDNGYMVTHGNGLQPVRNSESARALAHYRWHGKRQEKIAQAVREALENDDIQSIDVADAEVVGVLIKEVVLNPKVRGKDRVDAWSAILEQAGMDGRAPKHAENSTGTDNMSGLSGQTAMELLKMAVDMLNQRADNAPEVIDGTVK